jgi:hypothetical protein
MGFYQNKLVTFYRERPKNGLFSFCSMLGMNLAKKFRKRFSKKLKRREEVEGYNKSQDESS